MNTTERLAAHMEELDHAQVRGTGVEAVMEAGRRHNRRRTLAMSGLAVVAVVGLAAGANALQSAITDEGGDVAADNDLTLSAGEITWSGYESPVGNATFVTDGGTVYALTTAPGTRGMQPGEAPQAIFTTTDGESWTHQVLGGDVWVSDLDIDDGVLYAIGTAPGVSLLEGDGSIRISTSDDQGLNWSATDVPLAASASVGGLPVDGAWTNASIAAGDGAVVALVNTELWGDYTSLVPPEFTRGAVEVVATDDGVKVVDWDAVSAAQAGCGGDLGFDLARRNGAEPAAEPAKQQDGECAGVFQFDPRTDDRFTVYSATWEELGIEAGTPRVSEMFVSTGGGAFEAVETPIPSSSSARVVRVEGGFLVYLSEQGTTAAWFSSDGRTWRRPPNSRRCNG